MKTHIHASITIVVNQVVQVVGVLILSEALVFH